MKLIHTVPDPLHWMFVFRDSRYSHLVGRTVYHPFRREGIPIIADDHVDPAFGTGAVKVRNQFLNFAYKLPMFRIRSVKYRIRKKLLSTIKRANRS